MAMGLDVLGYSDIPDRLHHFRILINTVPHQPIPIPILDAWKDGIKLDLASSPGMVCDNVITARGLPGKYAPESTGKLIAESVKRILTEVRP